MKSKIAIDTSLRYTLHLVGTSDFASYLHFVRETL